MYQAVSQSFFGVDVGGTTVKLGLFDQDGHLLEKWEIPTDTGDRGSHILPDIAASVKTRITGTGEVAGVGIGVPGPVDQAGTVFRAVNLGWGVFNISEALGELLGGIPVFAGNDANVAALGEMWQGGGAGYRNIVLVTLGTGVGGGIIRDGKILTGARGAAGEIGHTYVRDGETEVCNCGKKGCLEQYTSATGIARLARRKLTGTGRPSSLLNQNISAKAVFDAVKEKDELAMEVAAEFGEILGKALAATANVVNPEAFVIGGGVSKAGNILFDYIVPYYNETVFHACRDVAFELAILGNDAGIYGAAKLALDNRAAEYGKLGS